jgi:hypothetical protein
MYGSASHCGFVYKVPPTISTHKLSNFQGDVATFSVLRDGRVRMGNKIYSRDEARSHYSRLLQNNWRRV